MTNDFTWLNEREIVCGAVRYYMGRSTMGAHGVARYVGDNIDQMDDGTRKILIRDIMQWLELNPVCKFAGVDDRAPWVELLERLESYGEV